MSRQAQICLQDGIVTLGTPNSVVGYAWDGPGEWEFADCGMQSVAYFLPPSAIMMIA